MPDVRISLQDWVYDSLLTSNDAEISASVHNKKGQRSLRIEQVADWMFQCYVDYCVL
jgi:hypothetical protein